MHVRVSPSDRLSTEVVEAAHAHVAFALARFSRKVRSVTVLLDDTGLGGGHWVCTVTVCLDGGGAVCVDHCDLGATAATARATSRAAREVARRLQDSRSWRRAGQPADAYLDGRQSP